MQPMWRYAACRRGELSLPTFEPQRFDQSPGGPAPRDDGPQTM